MTGRATPYRVSMTGRSFTIPQPNQSVSSVGQPPDMRALGARMVEQFADDLERLADA